MTDKDEELLADLLLRWEELRERGQDSPAAELCQDHPHLVEELARRINALKVTSWLDNPLGPGDDDSAPQSSTPAEPRTLIGRYRLDDLIATGGFAQVWRGYDLELQRVVAVKVPKPSRLESADTFMAEARRVARLKHPGIVPVHDVGREGDSCFIVSEFVEGGSLGDHLARNPPTQQQAVRWIAEIADALDYAHLHGVIHRDIKPANILIDHHGRALLADFGIAQSASRAGQEALSLGTLRYMSPEQLEGKTVDPRADIFSLGVVLYETLTGKLPYSSTEPNVLRREIVSGAKVEDGLPTELRRICQKSLQRNLHQRHTSAAHLAAELQTSLESSSPKSGGTRWMVTVVTLILAFGAFIGWKAQQPVPAEQKEKSVVGETPQVEQPVLDSVEPANQKKNPEFQEWLKQVAAIPATEQVDAISTKLLELNPDFQGRMEQVDFRIENGVVVHVGFFRADNLIDVSPLRVLTGPKSVSFNHCFHLSDISPLTDWKLLTDVEIFQTKVADISPLKGKPLTRLRIGYSWVNDLSPLEGIQLKSLDAHYSQVADLTPLHGMPLTTLILYHSRVVNLGPLEGMRLHHLDVRDTQVEDILPLKGMPLEALQIEQTKVKDTLVLKDMPLKHLALEFTPERDAEILRSIKTLETINGKPVAEFWKEVEQQQAEKNP